MASTNVACAKFVGVTDTSGMVEGMSSSLLSLENHGRQGRTPAVLGDEEPIEHVPDIITGDDIIRDLGLMVPVSGPPAAVPSQGVVSANIWGSGPTVGSEN